MMVIDTFFGTLDTFLLIIGYVCGDNDDEDNDNNNDDLKATQRWLYDEGN